MLLSAAANGQTLPVRASNGFQFTCRFLLLLGLAQQTSRDPVIVDSVESLKLVKYGLLWQLSSSWQPLIISLSMTVHY